ncbi:MAG: hypothetical protein ACU84J_10610 [Gammaproteobacteria bacterium]
MYANEYQDYKTQTATAENGEPSVKGLTAKITTYLRWVGSLLIVLSAVSFMLQGHEEIMPAYRYWIGLGLTLLLCGGGLICAYLFNETKGARIFFGLGTAFLPVQVSQVSAMIYAYWHGQAALQPQYRWLQFMDVSPAVIALDLCITAVLLLLVSYAGFAILARKHLKTLLSAFAAGNVLLLLPVRDATLAALIVAALYVFLRSIEQKLHHDRSMRLIEGLAARALISLPLWIVIGRSLLHPVSYLFAIVLSAIVAVYCIHDVKRYTRSSVILYLAQWLGTAAALATWFIAAARFTSISSSSLNILLPGVLVLFALSGKVDYHARLYRFAASVAALLLTYGAMLDHQPLAPVSTIATGLFLTLAGVYYREKIPFFTGNLCVIGGFLFYWDYAVDLYAAAPWVSSIALGLVVILLASYIENKEKQIIAKSRYYFEELKSWD